jgi:DNA-binding CsgD family transcriptional regulator
MERPILERLTGLPQLQSQSTMSSLHGREEQVCRIKQLMRATAEGHRAHLVVLGSGTGTGKTRLLLEALSLAARRGFAVLDSVPKSLTVVSSRNGRHDGDRINWPAGQVEASLDGHLRRGPVLVALDDAQWMDPAVLRALGALISKLVGAPVLWLFALRTEHAESVNGLLLRTLSRAHRSEWLGPLDPLSGDAVANLVGDLLGAVPDDDLVAVCESVGGTPQAIVDLVLGLCEQGCITVTVTDRVARLASGPLTSGISSAVAAEPGAQLPQLLLRVVRERLRALSPQAQDVLQVAAVLGSGFAPRDLAEMLDERPAQLLGPLQEALDAGLLGSSSDEFVFHREPEWRAVLDTVPEPLRSMLHQQAARMLLGRAEDETEAAAVHLVHCAEIGDSHAIATIREAAQRLLPASPHAAAALATRGMEITEPGGPDHIALATTATAALVRLGGLTQAIEFARGLLHDEHGGTGSTRSLRTWLATAQMLRGDASAAWHVSQEICTATKPSTDSADPCSELLLLNTLSHNNQTAVVGLADRVLSAADAHSDDVQAAALNVRAMANWRDGRLDDALAYVLAPVPYALHATILLAKGDIASAEADASAGLAASEQTEMPLYEPQLRAVLVVSALRRGDLAASADELRQLEECSTVERAHPWTALQRMLTALVTSARRGARAAMDEIREVQTDASLRMQMLLEDPSATAWTVRTALAADERDIAELVVATAEEIASGNRSYDTVVAAARHGRALLDGDVVALAGLEELYGDPWAAASVTEDVGSLHRETEREQAVAGLSRAMAIYDELGAEWDSARVRRKLRQLGVRRRHWNHEARPEAGWNSLTGTEEKVARLVARGLTNRQVASELFISPHTVGFHLRQIYRKLSIQSRVDLARIAP